MNKELTIASVHELARLTAWVMSDVVFLVCNFDINQHFTLFFEG